MTGLCTSAWAYEGRPIVVSTTVLPICRIQAVEDIRFGTLDPAVASNVIGEGAVTIACTRGVDFRLAVDSVPSGRRTMRGVGDTVLPYSILSSSLSGTANGFLNPSKIWLKASIRGEDYRDLPAYTYTDIIRVSVEY